MQSLAIVTNNPSSNSSKEFKRAIIKYGFEPLFIQPNYGINLLQNNNRNQLINENSIIGKSRVNMFIPRITNLNTYKHLLYHLTDVLGIYSAYSVEGLVIASDKMRTLQKASAKGLRVPKTALITNENEISKTLEIIGVPCVVKSIYGSKGVGVSILDSFSSAQSSIQTLLRYTHPLIIEEYIPTGRKDIRAIVIGNKVVAAMERRAASGDFRANLAQGGVGRPLTLSYDLEQFCIKAAHSLPLKIAGVDIILDKLGEPYLIEVNGNFGFGIQKITGVNLADEIVRYSIDEYEKKTKLTRVNMPNDGLEYEADVMKWYKECKGQKVKFTDINGFTQIIEIKSPDDILAIMFSTFKMNAA